MAEVRGGMEAEKWPTRWSSVWRFDVAFGDPATALIAAARRHRASTIVVGGRSHGVVGGLVVGAVAQKLVRHSPVSVLVVRAGEAHRLDVAPAGRR